MSLASNSEIARRIAGSLGGVACGDYLGKMARRRSADSFDQDFNKTLRAIRGKGDLAGLTVEPTVTDDTVLTLAVLRSVTECGLVSRTDIERRFREIDPKGGRQIYNLKASRTPFVLASDGLTNGCVVRSNAIAYFYGTPSLGDLIFDVVKVAFLTHGHPNALAAAALCAACTAYALDGFSETDIREIVPSLFTSIQRICGGGSVVFDSFLYALAQVRDRSCEDLTDHLERAIGLAVSAGSSVVTGLCVALAGFDLSHLECLISRRRAGWDLDSTAAVFGGLAGALYPSSVPRSLVSVLRLAIFVF